MADDPQKCECGARLPFHIARFFPNLEHTCSCGRHFKYDGTTFVPDGNRTPIDAMLAPVDGEA